MYRSIPIDYLQDSTRNRTRTTHKSSQICNHICLLILQLEEDLTRHQKEEQEGTALQTFPDSNLFFVDKVAGMHSSVTVTSPCVSEYHAHGTSHICRLVTSRLLLL